MAPDEETGPVGGEGSHMGEMKRRIAWESEQSARFASTVAICASIICAVRLACDDIHLPTPKVVAAVADNVGLARMILKSVVGSRT
jgi:hypothetical protein